MHVWQKTFKRASQALSVKEAEVLALPAPARPAWAVKNATTVVSSSDPAVLELFQVTGTASGSYVTESTAMKVSAVYACVRLIAGALATLPLPVYSLDQDNNRVPAPEHPVRYLLNAQPTARFTGATWMEFIGAQMLLRGDSIAIIRRNKAGVPQEIIPIARQNVVIQRVDDRLHYYVQDLDKFYGFDQDDILHFPGFGFNGVASLSVIQHAAFQSIGTAISTEEYAGKYFANGATPKIWIENPGTLDDTQIERLRNLWDTRYSGTDNAHKPLILYGGMKANALSINAEDSQLLESRRFSVEDIARAFGVPPHMIGHLEKTTSFGSGVEQMGLNFLLFTLLPHLTRIEQEINRKLFRITRYFVEFNKNGLMQADAAGRAKYYREAIGGSQGPGWMLINEIRKLENLPPLPGGDKLYTPQAATDPKGSSNAAQ